MSRTRASASSRVPNTERQMKTRGHRPTAFICFEVFGTRDEARSPSFFACLLKWNNKSANASVWSQIKNMFHRRWKPGDVLSGVSLSIKIHPPDPNGCHLLAFDWGMINEFENFCSQQVFSGNLNAAGLVKNRISSPFHCTAVRIRAINWQGRMCMRSELYGCEPYSWAAEKRERQPLAKLSDRKSVVIIMELLVRSYAGHGRPRNLGKFQGNLQPLSQSSSAISDTWRHLSFLSWCRGNSVPGLLRSLG